MAGTDLSKIDPEFAEGLSQTDRRAAERFRVRSVQLNEGPPDSVLAEDGVFGAVVLSGLLVHQSGVANQEALRLIGPNEIIVPLWGSGPLLASSELYVIDSAALALLDTRILDAIARWPRIAEHLIRRMSDQAEEICAQMVIGHLPKVDDRILAMMWLLAQRFGRMTSNGVLVPIAPKHSTIGALIGARRPTVTLAMNRLLERDAMKRVENGWLLLEPLAEDAGVEQNLELPELAGGNGRRLRSGPSDQVRRKMLPASTLLARERAMLRLIRTALEDPDRYDPWTMLRAIERRLTT